MGEEAKQEQVKPEEAKTEEKAEEKKEEKAEAEEKTEEPKPPPPFVLFVDLHCVGCAKKIERSIMKIRGVEAVAIDMAKKRSDDKGDSGASSSVQQDHEEDQKKNKSPVPIASF